MSDKNTSCISSKPLTRPSSQPPRHTVHPESGHCSCTKRHLTPAHHRALPVSPWAFRQTPQRPGLGPVQVIQLNSLLYFFTSETGPLKRSFCFKELHGGSKGGNRKKRVRGMREREIIHPPTYPRDGCNGRDPARSRLRISSGVPLGWQGPELGLSLAASLGL